MTKYRVLKVRNKYQAQVFYWGEWCNSRPFYPGISTCFDTIEEAIEHCKTKLAFERPDIVWESEE